MNGYLGNFKAILTPVARKCKLLNSPAAGETCTIRKPFVSLHLVCMRKTRRNLPSYCRIFERFGIKTTATVVQIQFHLKQVYIYLFDR